MTDLYEFHSGHAPLLVSIPHAGTRVPDAIFGRFSNAGKKLPDTDWFVPQLYDFVKDLGAHLIVANFSRYVIDLNRPSDDKNLYEDEKATGLIPKTLFDGSPLYAAEEPFTEEDIKTRVDTYWRPYHDKLKEVIAGIKEAHGYALLYDAHSIASRIPNLFKGKLPDFNLGTNNAESCAPELGYAIAEVIRASSFSSTINGRFIGGYITRHYGKPAKNVHALQMEVGQASYMDEETIEYDEEKAEKLIPVLKDVVTACLSAVKPR
jgi:N-formylglutamate amidohydrolase